MIARAVIFGSGAIGSLLAAGAQTAGLDFNRIVRNNSIERVKLLDGSEVLLPAPVDIHSQNLWKSDLYVFPLKSYQIETAIIQYIQKIPKGSAIVLLHNGMGSYDLVAKHLQQHYVYLATTSHGAYKVSPQLCVHTGSGSTNLGTAGSLSNEAMDKAVYRWLESALSPVHWQTNIQCALWQKLAVNAVINTLTAIHDIRNGELLLPKFDSEIAKLISEIQELASAERINLVKGSIHDIVYDVIRNTADNYSSMHQDLKYKKHTEIEAITGFLIEKARIHNIDCPTNQAIYKEITMLQASYAGKE